ncbi:MAG TPA: isochorismatase family cysteine hydrolase [Chthoniobacterales bacterium]|nr:isochorismatase family cysteine hydrolase [Chthoniobacterales bacterium]
MPKKNASLHGSAPDKCKTALLLIDVINDLEFPEADQMLGAALQMAENLLLLKQRARKAGVPVIYVNDNFGKWKSDFRATIEHCLRGNVNGREVTKMLRPQEEDYFVLKPKHSGFFSTTLETLLRYLGSSRLILTGIAGNFCVLFTANDAYMRDFEIVVPRDCTVSNTGEENERALQLMRKFLKAKTPLSTEIKFRAKPKQRR